MSFTRPYGYKEGTFLYEQDRLRSCGLPKVPINGKIAGKSQGFSDRQRPRAAR